MSQRDEFRREMDRGAAMARQSLGLRDDDKAKDKKPDSDEDEEGREDELVSEGPADDDDDDEDEGKDKDKDKKKDDDDRKRSARSARSLSSTRVRSSARTHLADIRAHRREADQADEQRVSQAVDFERGKEHALKVAERSRAVGLRRR